MPTFGLNPQAPNPFAQPGGMNANAGANNVPKSNGGPIQSPGNNLLNPGYSEQAFEYTQNRLMEDPYAQQTQALGQASLHQGQGEKALLNNLGTLNGPGQGDQYWNQVQGQYMDPFAGEQYARQATQNFGAQGAASAFNDKAQGQYDAYTNYSTGNAQGQYGQSSQQLAGGTQGEQGLGQIAGQYGAIGQYNGQNHAQGQYQQNAASGPMAAQSFYDQVGGSYGQIGQYQDPNRAAGQYEQTQGAFGDMPIANFDPFFDRAIQLGTQDYNRQTAGRGVYGSSEALSGVGNIITDLNAQRALKGFDAEMQRAQEQRARQQLLGEQARMGDLSGLGAFSANMQGLETYGNLANNAGNQTIQQQTMLGNQARDADVSATDAFSANLKGAETFGNINDQLASQELGRHELLGTMANSADTQATNAQNARTDAMSAFGDLANNADRNEIDRYTSSTNAMYNADRMGLDRMNAGADIAFGVDDGNREDYTAEANAATNAANIRNDRVRTTKDIYDTGSDNDLDRLRETNNQAGNAERDRQARQIAKLNATGQFSNDMLQGLSKGMDAFYSGDKEAWNDYFNAQLGPKLQAAGFSQQEQQAMRGDINALLAVLPTIAEVGQGGGGSGARPLDPNPY
jgi:hypothetical protein